LAVLDAINVRALVKKAVRSAIEASEFLADRSLGRALQTRVDGEIDTQARVFVRELLVGVANKMERL